MVVRLKKIRVLHYTETQCDNIELGKLIFVPALQIMALDHETCQKNLGANECRFAGIIVTNQLGFKCL